MVEYIRIIREIYAAVIVQICVAIVNIYAIVFSFIYTKLTITLICIAMDVIVVNVVVVVIVAIIVAVVSKRI